MANLKSELIYVRVLEQDTCDQIRAGHSYPIYKDNLDKEVEKVKKAYGERMAGCGGWTDKNNNKYHERIALVDAETLQPVREIWKKKH
jgi:hypothetical protein